MDMFSDHHITYLYFAYCNSYFIRDVHRELGLINANSFDILPAMSSRKVREKPGFYLSGE